MRFLLSFLAPSRAFGDGVLNCRDNEVLREDDSNFERMDRVARGSTDVAEKSNYKMDGIRSSNVNISIADTRWL